MFFMFLCFTDCLYGCVFFSDILLIYSAVYLLTYFCGEGSAIVRVSDRPFIIQSVFPLAFKQSDL